ncbi:UDP-glucose 4-epimerase [Allocatelliglobosispora scoriae]|uniref:UDP-glucose 4-epimerase n=1 Tax=Allocatelliglobosispora scoriae TaxID=643052 RepID=A0A841BNE7_9ACTN|nr:NAD-dependent epimerase/dehydratase family protein [Allocatelliglobosispora scoriae]MBB5868330.1 UDP-glucose 4-epimerase [Allocatelliglobosispora scoriae]
MSTTATLVTGGAGFIGSHVVDHLVRDGVPVVVIDNLSNTTRRLIQPHLDSGAAVLHELDVLDTDAVAEIMAGGVGRVIHLAASVDMRVALENNWIDIEQSILATRSVLEAMRHSGVGHITFSSSSTVYGEPSIRPTAEHHGPMLPISVYGAAKLGAEGLISAYNHLYGIEGAIFRFGNVVGGRMNHGVIFDFLRKLERDPKRLEVLGDGLQRKNYFLAEDCARGIIELAHHANGGVLVANLGTTDTVTVTRIAEIVLAELGLDAEIAFGTGVRGWPGDVPVVEFDLSRAHELGWTASKQSEEAIREAVRRLIQEESHG